MDLRQQGWDKQIQRPLSIPGRLGLPENKQRGQEEEVDTLQGKSWLREGPAALQMMLFPTGRPRAQWPRLGPLLPGKGRPFPSTAAEKWESQYIAQT